MFCELKVAAPGPQPSRLAREAVPGAEKRSWDAGGGVDVWPARVACNLEILLAELACCLVRPRSAERRRNDEYATRNAPGSCRYSDAATIAETGRDFGMQGGTSSSDACNNRLEHSAGRADVQSVHGHSASRYGRRAAAAQKFCATALVRTRRRDALERDACHRAGIFRPVEDLRVVAADGRGHAHRRRRR